MCLGKHDYLKARVEKAVAIQSGWSMLSPQYPWGGLCGSVSPESQMQDTKQNPQGVDPADGKLMRVFRTTPTGELMGMS